MIFAASPRFSAEVEGGGGDLGRGEGLGREGGVGAEGGEGDEDGDGRGEGGVGHAGAHGGGQLADLAAADLGEAAGEGALPAEVLDELDAGQRLGHEPRALVGDLDGAAADRTGPGGDARLEREADEHHEEAREGGGPDFGPSDGERGEKDGRRREEHVKIVHCVTDALGVVGQKGDSAARVDARVSDPQSLVVDHGANGCADTQASKDGYYPVLVCAYRPARF